MEQFAAIRRDHRVEGLSIRALADRHGVHRRTVRQALESAIRPARKTPQRVAPRLDPFKTAIDEMLRSALDAPKKQRHTARMVLARRVDEHDAVGLSYSTVRDYVRKRRPKSWPRRANRWSKDTCRRPMSRGPRRRSTFMTCGWCLAG
ncbi:helix-turn-helix domain protein [Mycobacterium kansasii]|uniref:Helix-turn-helix domain protein n=1 Tax=Mycobacterium kansasii TaxID=1768 RepID=A0A1V3XGY3_MYCKA|nr:helix-turn-helix domain protein [Mycobacterium kansasii]